MRDIEQQVKGWQPVRRPEPANMAGQYVALSPLMVSHAQAIFDATSKDKTGAGWQYMPVGPFGNIGEVRAFLQKVCAKPDPMFFAITDLSSGKVCGFASFLRINPDQGSIEVGYIYFAPELQKTRAATEAMFLMMQQVFDLGYRRYEWKCNAANGASMAAAKRLGFTFEGVFRQAMVVKGRNRDTAWFSIVDGEWPALCDRFQKWLSPENFDADGRQITRL
ncbi:MAG: GNAT family N-acetyltransferase [Rhodobacteraceae bacterium]|nr:GNAT family N-acetyltransferase [Paracoccaceae bacterium]